MNEDPDDPLARCPDARQTSPDPAARVAALQLVSPDARLIEHILRRLARCGQSMPNNPILGEMAGGRHRQSIVKALERLRRAGIIRIDVDRALALRRVTFPDDGTTTDWGDARPGHAPFSSRPRGSPSQPRPRSAESRPMAVRSAPDLPPSAGQSAGAVTPTPTATPAPAIAAVFIGPAPVCQWPGWADGEQPSGRYCGQPSQPGRSWCTEHTYLAHGRPLGPRHTSVRFPVGAAGGASTAGRASCPAEQCPRHDTVSVSKPV